MTAPIDLRQAYDAFATTYDTHRGQFLGELTIGIADE